MKVKDLVNRLLETDQELDVTVFGAYGSEGDIEDVVEADKDGDFGGPERVVIVSDIMSG